MTCYSTSITNLPDTEIRLQTGDVTEVSISCNGDWITKNNVALYFSWPLLSRIIFSVIVAITNYDTCIYVTMLVRASTIKHLSYQIIIKSLWFT